ncbi:hypothetical protein GCM10009118_08860 [Wandonia haliotis]|uniref:Polysaccharide chain length determinant N-terminal domain-containing protein n=1 Tax=Wandonia haliotis TaxID=574963 RepID=A0ABN1MMH0_9FLAO
MNITYPNSKIKNYVIKILNLQIKSSNMSQNKEEMFFVDLLKTTVKKWKVVLLILTTSLLISSLYSFYIVKVSYFSEAQVLISSDDEVETEYGLIKLPSKNYLDYFSELNNQMLVDAVQSELKFDNATKQALKGIKYKKQGSDKSTIQLYTKSTVEDSEIDKILNFQFKSFIYFLNCIFTENMLESLINKKQIEIKNIDKENQILEARLNALDSAYSVVPSGTKISGTYLQSKEVDLEGISLESLILSDKIEMQTNYQKKLLLLKEVKELSQMSEEFDLNKLLNKQTNIVPFDLFNDKIQLVRGFSEQKKDLTKNLMIVFLGLLFGIVFSVGFVWAKYTRKMITQD